MLIIMIISNYILSIQIFFLKWWNGLKVYWKLLISKQTLCLSDQTGYFVIFFKTDEKNLEP